MDKMLYQEAHYGLTPVFSVLVPRDHWRFSLGGAIVPNRIIKETICTSEEIETLGADEEVFFYRLLVVADDFGLMDARPAILKARCYPLKPIEIKRIQEMLVRLHNVGLIQVYRVQGKPYLHLTNWAKHQQIRAKRAKYPTIDEADDCNGNQLIADAPVIQSNPIQSESESNQVTTGKPSRFDASKMDLPDSITRSSWSEWVAYRRKRKLTTAEDTMSKQIKALSEWASAGHNPESIIESSITNGWQGLFEPKATPVAQRNNAKDPRFHFDTPEYRVGLAAQTEKYKTECTPEQLAMANEDF